MTSVHGYTAARLSAIKGLLDPGRSYLVAETESSEATMAPFGPVLNALHGHGPGVVDRRLIYDSRAGRLFLLVEIASKATESIREALMQIHLPPEIAIYYFRSQP